MRTRLGRHFVLAATLALVSGLGEDALAASPAGVQREGFLIGLSVGAGGIRYPSGAGFNCTYTYYPTFRQECTRTDTDYSTKPGFAVGFRIGSMVSKRVALMLDGTGMSISADGEVLASGVDTAAIQHWVTEKTWIKADKRGNGDEVPRSLLIWVLDGPGRHEAQTKGIRHEGRGGRNAGIP